MFMFRADGNGEIGSGHIMRCLSIADAGREYLDQDSLFVLARDSFRELIEKRGHRCTVLDTDYRFMEPETGKMKELIAVHRPCVLFADSYYVTSGYLKALQAAQEKAGGRLVYVDDIMAFAYPCHILINYNIYGPGQRETYEDLYREAHIALPDFVLGPSYVPLRAEFQNLPKRKVRREAGDILISTGGADAQHLALGLAHFLADSRKEGRGESFSRFRFHFVIGAMNGDLEEIRAVTKDDERIFLHVQVRDMEQLMSRCDVALSAAGSTLYELCAVQTPTVTYILADNQIPGAKGFEQKHILECIGDVRNLNHEELPEKMLAAALGLAGDYERRKAVCARQRTLVDGSGAKRIAQRVLECKRP